MSLFKRGSTWWVDFTTPGGQRTRVSAGTESKQEAQGLHDLLKVEAWRVEKLGEKPVYTWDQAALQWLMETQHKKTHEEDKVKLRWLQQFLSGKALNSISRELIWQITDTKLMQASPATANRYLALINAILRKVVREWEWMDKVPKITLFKESKRRVRWLTPDQVRTLLEVLEGVRIFV